MTYAARQVLEDCKLALQLLEDETDLQVWRIHWVAALALIRAVGHVLHKVDGKKPAFTKEIRNAYQKWQSYPDDHEIFFKFINKERNNLLKEYQFNLHPSEEVEVAVVLTATNPVTGKTVQIPQTFPIGENIYRPILDGYREGDDARDVYSDAINWWGTELKNIEIEA